VLQLCAIFIVFLNINYVWMVENNFDKIKTNYHIIKMKSSVFLKGFFDSKEAMY